MRPRFQTVFLEGPGEPTAGNVHEILNDGRRKTEKMTGAVILLLAAERYLDQLENESSVNMESSGCCVSDTSGEGPGVAVRGTKGASEPFSEKNDEKCHDDLIVSGRQQLASSLWTG